MSVCVCGTLAQSCVCKQVLHKSQCVYFVTTVLSMCVCYCTLFILCFSLSVRWNKTPVKELLGKFDLL